jgi:hypothetical protein
LQKMIIVVHKIYQNNYHKVTPLRRFLGQSAKLQAKCLFFIKN